MWVEGDCFDVKWVDLDVSEFFFKKKLSEKSKQSFAYSWKYYGTVEYWETLGRLREK